MLAVCVSAVVTVDEIGHERADRVLSDVLLGLSVDRARLGRRVVYREKDVAAWLDEQFGL